MTKTKTMSNEVLTLFDDISDSLLIFRNSIVYWSNKAFSDISGFSSNELIGKKIETIFPEKMNAILFNYLSQKSSQENTVDECVVYINSKGDKDVEREAQIKNYHIDGIQFIALIFQAESDITKLNKLIDKQREAEREIFKNKNLDHESMNKDYAARNEELIEKNEVYELLNKKLSEEIDRHKKTEEKLRESEKTSRLIVSEVKDYAIFMLNPKGIISSWNEGAQRIKGYKSDEIIGKHFSSFYDQEDIDNGKPDRELKIAIEEGRFEDEGWRIRKNKTKFWANVIITSLKDESGKLVGFSKVTRDITERKLAEEELKNSKEKYMLLFKNMNEGFAHAEIITDNIGKPVDWRYLDINPAFEKLTGLKRNNVIGRRITEILPGVENDEADWIGKYGNVALSGKSMYLEDYSGPLKKWYSVKVFCPKIGEFAATFEDITKRKKAEENLIRKNKEYISLNGELNKEVKKRIDSEKRLVESEELFRGIFESDMVGELLWDADGNISEANDCFLNMVGYSKEDLLGGKLNWKELTPPEYKKFDEEKLTELAEKGVIEPFEKEYIHKNGRRIPILISAATLLGKKYSGVAIILDISAKKQAEQELKLKNNVFEASIAANSIADINGAINYVNQSFLDMWGYKTKEDAIGNSVADFFVNQEDAAPVLEALNNVGQWEGEFLAKRRDGKQFISKGLATVIKDKDGNMIGYQSANLDVTAQKRAEEELVKKNQEYHSLYEEYLSQNEELKTTNEDLEKKNIAFEKINKKLTQEIQTRQKAEKEIQSLNQNLEEKVIERTMLLEEANKELESFSYSVSHDLRAPLRAITGYSNILLEDYSQKLDEEGQLTINTVIRNVKKMDCLIENILQFSRIGRKDIVRSKVNIERIFMSVYYDLEKLESKRKIKFTIENELPIIQADKSMIEIVITNLISNAIKFTAKKEEAQIMVGYESDDENNIFHVKDNGAGFEEQYKDKLFGVFQRLHSECEFHGTGVGLATAKRIIQKHKGNIWATSIPEVETIFYFSLPKSI